MYLANLTNKVVRKNLKSSHVSHKRRLMKKNNFHDDGSQEGSDNSYFDAAVFQRSGPSSCVYKANMIFQ